MYPDTHSKLPYIFVSCDPFDSEGDPHNGRCAHLQVLQIQPEGSRQVAKDAKNGEQSGPERQGKHPTPGNHRISIDLKPIKFQKLEHSLMCRSSRNQTPNWESYRSPKVKKFLDISSKRGAFICGPR